MQPWTSGIALLAGSLYASASLPAHEAHHGGAHQMPAATATAAEVTLLDRPLVDDSGDRLQLRDAVSRRPSSIIGFFYSTCDVACPITTVLLQGVMARLPPSERNRTQVVLITIDPGFDTPEVLSAYRARMRVPDDWLVLTGRPADVNEVLVGLGAYTTEVESHPPQILVRSEPEAEFVRLFGLPSTHAVAQVLAQP